MLKLEVPGIKQEDLDVQLENNTLTVRGERKFEKEEKKENFHRIERRYGTFFRSFTLPTTVDSENVKAQYDSGVLKLELNKRAEAKPKQIKIGVAGVPAATEKGTDGSRQGRSLSRSRRKLIHGGGPTSPPRFVFGIF